MFRQSDERRSGTSTRVHCCSLTDDLPRSSSAARESRLALEIIERGKVEEDASLLVGVLNLSP